MRIALIADIHGNGIALTAVLDDIDRTGVDQLVCLGDLATLGPAPASVIDTVRERGCPCILGNHDAFLFDPALIDGYTQEPSVVDSVDWCRDRVAAEEVDFLRTFPATMSLSLDGGATLLVFHGSPRSHMENLLATTPPGELDEMLEGHRATVMAGGHTHVQMLRQHRGTLIVNPGSVGLPFREFVAGRAPTLMDHAEYAILEAGPLGVDVRLRRVPLDRSALREAARASDNPLRGMLLEQYA